MPIRNRTPTPLQTEKSAAQNAVGIVPPGKLHDEDRDAALTGDTRSLERRVLGLDVLQTVRRVARKRPAAPEK